MGQWISNRGRFLLQSAAIVLGSLSVTLWYALRRGQDFNWDQQNYHLSTPFLLKHGAYWSSVSPSGIQTYFNPYVLQLDYFGIEHLSPVVFVTILAIAQSVTFMIAGLVCVEIADSAGRAAGETRTRSVWLGLLGFALCLMAPAALSEAGTTIIDLLTAAPVVAAYAVLLLRGRRLGLMTAGALAGALIGLATALKLTNGVFALGIVGFALAGREPVRRRLAWLILCGASAALAFLAVSGSWQFGLWKRFGNPFFPYYNNIFHAPGLAATPLRDGRFLPHSALDFWRYPLYWLFGGSPNSGVGSPSSELHIADARWAFVTFGAVAFVAALALFPNWRKQRLAEPATGFFFAVLIGYAAWLAQFGIHRYMAPLDVLCGAAVLFLAAQIPWPPIRLGLLAAIAVLSWRVLAVPDWGHAPWRPYWQGIEANAGDLRGAPIVFLTEKPMAYIAASLPTDARYVGIYGDFDLQSGSDLALARQLSQMLTASPNAELKAVDLGAVPRASAAILASYGLVVTPNCQDLKMPDQTLRLCDVERK